MNGDGNRDQAAPSSRRTEENRQSGGWRSAFEDRHAATPCPPFPKRTTMRTGSWSESRTAKSLLLSPESCRSDSGAAPRRTPPPRGNAASSATPLIGPSASETFRMACSTWMNTVEGREADARARRSEISGDCLRYAETKARMERMVRKYRDR